MIVFDASVLIAYLDGNDANHDTAVQLLEREIDEDFSASGLTLAEVLVGPVRAGHIDDAVAALRDLEVSEQPSAAGLSVRLARLRAESGLRMPDCCVLLAAQEASARVAAFDTALLKAAAKLGFSTLSA